jgi:Flp pilus assembly secretin CpaC
MDRFVDAEWEWIARRFPNAMMVPGGSTSFLAAGRWYTAVSFTTADGKEKTVYFDITYAVHHPKA